VSDEGVVRRRGVLAVVLLGLLGGQAGAGAPAFSARAGLRGHPAKSATTVKPATVVTYAVRQGDSLTAVARRLGVSVTALAAANGITNINQVRVGQVLTLAKPDAPTRPDPVAAAPLAPLPSPVVVVGGETRHRVVLGENLARIASRYGTTVSELARANNLASPNLIREGDELVVPGASWVCPVQGPRQFADSWGAPRPGGRRHLGTDIFAVRGTPVVASIGGVLERADGATAGLAYYLRGDDGVTYYGAHLDGVEAVPGRLDQGARIGTVGSTGNAKGTTPHLHFEIKPGGGASVNPIPSLERWCRS